jgi:chromosome partitioning protein
VASSIRLARADETELIRRNTTTLSKRISLLKDVYDIILLDCPPNLGRLTGNALCAADYYLVPLKGGDIYSLDGFDDLEMTVREARDDNPKLTRLGVFFNAFDGRKNVAKLLAKTANERFGVEMFKTCVPDAVAFQEAAVLSKTVLETQRDGTAAKAIVELADEILARLGMGAQYGQA